MKKILSLILICTMFFSILVFASAENNEDNDVLLNISSDNFKFINEIEMEENGPKTFFVDEENMDIYIADTLNNEIKVFNGNELINTISIPKQIECVSMYINENQIFLLDSQANIFKDTKIIVIDKKGSLIDEINIPLNEKNAIESNLPQLPKGFTKLYNPVKAIQNIKNNKIILEYSNGKVFTFDQKNNNFTEKVNKLNKKELYTKNKVSLITPKTTENKNVNYVTMYEKYNQDSKTFGNIILKRLDENSNVIGSAKLINDERHYEKDNIRIGNKGVYHFITNNNNVKVIKLNFDKSYKLDEIEKTLPNNKDSNSIQSISISSSGLYPDDVFATAASYQSHEWEYDSSKNGLHVSGTELPDYLEDAEGVYDCVSVPYCWGGYQSLETFDSTISDGWQAGNSLCTGDYKDGTSGVDCSGFVSICYEIGYKLSTMGIATSGHFSPIDEEDAGYLDIYNNAGSHVLIMLNTDGDGVYSIESAKTGDDCVEYRYRSNSFLTYYTPMKFNNWAE